MHILIEQWRRQAKGRRQSIEDAGERADDDLTAEELIRCADELEQTWHDEQHDATWNFDCALCMREMQAASRKAREGK